MGGLSRRATIIDGLRAKGPVFVVDAGDLFWRSGTLAQGVVAQQKEKAKLQSEAYALAGIDAMLPAEGDLALGLDFVKEMATTHQLPYVASDLVCDGAAPFPAVRTAERGGITLAAVGLVGPVDVPGCARTDAAPALKAALAGVKADVVVLLSADPDQVTAKVAAEVGGVDFLVVADRRLTATPTITDGGALRLGAGSRGKHLGSLAFTLVPGGEGWRDEGALTTLATERDRYQKRVDDYRDKLARMGPEAPAQERERAQKQVEFYTQKVADVDAKLANASRAAAAPNRAVNTMWDLDDAIADHPATLALVAKAKVAIEAAAPTGLGLAADSPYVGNAACEGCHAAETAQWQGTAHARAWQSLLAKRSQMDPACYKCHVTGAFDDAGPQTAQAAVGAKLLGVGCEACHGPGKAHVANPAAASLRADPGVDTCVTCHDGEQDGGRFEYPTYRPKIVHGAGKP